MRKLNVNIFVVQELVNWCKPSPCKNGGICRQSGTRYSCQCLTGWTGLYCDVPSVSCEVAAKQQGRFVCMHVPKICLPITTHFCRGCSVFHKSAVMFASFTFRCTGGPAVS